MYRLLVGVGAYLGIGMYVKRQRGERGVEQVPNIDFWRSVVKRIKNVIQPQGGSPYDRVPVAREEGEVMLVNEDAN